MSHPIRNSGVACVGEDADGHVGEHGDRRLWANGHAQPLLQTSGCGGVEWVSGGGPRGDRKSGIEEWVYAQGLQARK